LLIGGLFSQRITVNLSLAPTMIVLAVVRSNCLMATPSWSVRCVEWQKRRNPLSDLDQRRGFAKR
jgi:hypothetical protein